MGFLSRFHFTLIPPLWMKMVLRFRNPVTQTHRAFTEPEYHPEAIMGAPDLSAPCINWQTDLFQWLRHNYLLFSITSCLINAADTTRMVSVNSMKHRTNIFRSLLTVGRLSKASVMTVGDGPCRTFGINKDVLWGDLHLGPLKIFRVVYIFDFSLFFVRTEKTHQRSLTGTSHFLKLLHPSRKIV